MKLRLAYQRPLLNICSTGEDNAATIIEYIAAVKNEVNLSDNYRKDLIESLALQGFLCSSKHIS